MKNRRLNQGGNNSGGPIRQSDRNQKGKQQQKEPYSRPQGNNQGQYRPMAQNPNGGKQIRDGQLCYRCGRPGHHANDCTAKDPVCFNCNKPGHFVKDCKAPKAEPRVGTTRAKGKRPTTSGRVFLMGGREVERSDDLT